MRNCQRCRPCRPCDGGSSWQQSGCGCSGANNGGVETIVEPTVHCDVKEHHHHQRVRHIVPIVYHQRHHHHKHHEYEVKRKYTQEHRHHEHGRFDGDWCEQERRGSGGQGGQCSQSMSQSDCGCDSTYH